MASKSQSRDKTLWTVALIALAILIVIKVLPAILKRLQGGGSSGGSGAGGGGGYYDPFNPDSGQQQGGFGQPLSLGGNPGNGGGGGFGPSGGLSGASLLNALTGGEYATGPGSINYYGDVSQQGYDAINNDTIPLQPLTGDSSFQNWFSNWYLPDTSSAANENQGIDTQSIDLGGLSSSGDLSNYDFGSTYSQDNSAPVDYSSAANYSDPSYSDSTGDAGGYFSGGDYGSSDS